jgi:prepilin-type N-terminal cleavage/methylation domain-containing protein
MKRFHARKVRAFTLLELIITLVLMSILMVMIVPSWENFRRSQAANAAASDFRAEVSRANREAIQYETNIRFFFTYGQPIYRITYPDLAAGIKTEKQVNTSKIYHGTIVEPVSPLSLSISLGGNGEVNQGLTNLTRFTPGGEAMGYYIVKFKNKLYTWEVWIYDDGHTSLNKTAG